MKVTDVLRERVAGMTSEELAGVLSVVPGRYQGEFLEVARQELRHRGFIFNGNGDGGISTPDGLTLKPQAPLLPPPVVPPTVNGIGGWLLLYILGHLVCRPLSALNEGVGTSAAAISQLAEVYPTTAQILQVDKVLSVGLVISGLLVAIALLKKGTSSPVKLAKAYLIGYPLSRMFMAALYGFSDFAEPHREKFVQAGMRGAVVASLWSLVWLLYFNRSKRVKATYFPDESTPG